MLILFIQNLLGNNPQEDLLEKHFKTWQIQNTLSGNDQTIPSDSSSEPDNPLAEALLFIGSKKNSFFYALNKKILLNNLNNSEIPVFFSLQMINMQKNCYIINIKLFLNKINEIFNQSEDINFNSFCQEDLNVLNKQYFNVSNVENKILINSINDSRYLFIEPEQKNNIYLKYRNLYVKYYKPADQEKDEEIQKLFFDKFLNMIRADAIVYTKNIQSFNDFYWYVLYDQNKSEDEDRLEKFFTLNQENSSSLEKISFYQYSQENPSILQTKNTFSGNDQTMPSDSSSEPDNPLAEALLFIGSQKSPFFYALNKKILLDHSNNPEIPVFFSHQMRDMQKNCYIIEVKSFLRKIHEIFNTSRDIRFDSFCQTALNVLNKKYFNTSDIENKILLKPGDSSLYLFIEPKEENNIYVDYMNLYVQYYISEDQKKHEDIQKAFFHTFLSMILENTILYTQAIKNFESFYAFVLDNPTNKDISKKNFRLNEEVSSFFTK